ncbi:hypothetical protein [Kineosporia sp. R_H_3]|uniref:hypothetical protein n=1 Tax=Kineosporia sp. R_H_3 TaxID=1961848 RepID=UPI000B4AC6CD|nr:hypothetical protein [Kineosporia sp. R_H_3]
MPVTWLVGDLATGRVTNTIPLVGGTWTDTLDAAGSLGGTLALADPAVAALRPRVIAQPGRTFLAAAWTGTDGEEEAILAAGPIWVHSYDDDKQTLQIGAAGAWSYYDHRKVLPVLTGTQTPAGVELATSDVTLGTIAKKLVEVAHTHTGGALPVVLPADIAGVEARTYPGYEMAWVGEAMRALTTIEGGPEIAFTPRRSTADPRNIEWVMRTGTDTSPLLTQSGADWVWDHSVPGSRVVSLSVDVDGSKVGSRAWAPGSGSGESRIIGRADDPTLTGPGYVLLEVEDTARDGIENLATLNAYATALAVRSRTAPESWSVKVRAGGHPSPGMVRPGDWARIVVGTHPYLDEGEQRGRITQLSGTDDGDLTIAFQREI